MFKRLKSKSWYHRQSFRLWRSSAYNRGYYEAMQSRPEHDARNQAWINFLERYYYKHQNCHLRGDIEE